MTFDVLADVYVGRSHGWLSHHEACVLCRRCRRTSILKVALRDIDFKDRFLENGSLTQWPGDLEPILRAAGFQDVADLTGLAETPGHVPDEIAAAFSEGAKCLAIGCFNAAAAMFRLCLDLVTRPLLPDPANASVPQPSKRERFNLGPRIDWLIGQGIIPQALSELAHCVRQDGNDGVHAGSLDDKDAADLVDFTTVLLERQFTEPARLREARARQEARRRVHGSS